MQSGHEHLEPALGDVHDASTAEKAAAALSTSADPMDTVSAIGDDNPLRQFYFGATPFFASQYDQRFSYCVYTPESYRPGAPHQPLVVVVHGTERRPELARDEFIDLADRSGCVLLAPLFPAGLGDPNDLHTYKFIERGGVRYDHVLLGLVSEVGYRWGLDVDRFHMRGFSGGGQFANRFLYLHPERLASVSVGAPGRVTLADRSTTWPAGIGDVEHKFGVELNWEVLADVPVQIVVGSDDDQIRPLEPGGDRSRLDRARDLADSLSSVCRHVQLAVVPGVAHDSAATAPEAARFFAERIRAKPNAPAS